MSDILARLLAKVGAETAPRSTKAGALYAQEGVHEGPELLRIRALPRRRWQDDPQLEELTDAQTARFKRTNALEPDARLFPVQAVGLAEFELYNRLTAVWSIGTGKTLASALLPTVAKAKRPLLLLPAALIDKTRREFKTLSKTWFVHPSIQLFSYERISLANYKTFLQDGRFDLILADESHNLKNPKAGRTRRIGDYLIEAGLGNVPFVPLTGSPGDSSVGNLAHYLYWSQGEHSPLPKPGTWELVQICQATDERTRELRREPGALLQFVDSPPESADQRLVVVREGLGRRIEETPGVVYHRHASVDCSLYIDAWINETCSSAIEDVFEHVRETGDEMPDGRVLETALDRHSTFSTLSLGFCRYLDPPPPDDWRAARKAYRSFVNECIDDRGLGFDTPGEVTLACESGNLDSFGVYEMWRDIEPSFKPISRVHWFSEEVLALLAEWMSKNDAIVWVPYPAFGRALARRSGRPFFHHQGMSLTHGSIEAYESSDAIIASTQSNATGRNLQRWAKNLIVGPSAKADLQEQQIGRTHRAGQKADAVEVTYFVGSVENLDAIDRARYRARIDNTLGRNQAHKLLACDWLLSPTEDVLRKLSGPRWSK